METRRPSTRLGLFALLVLAWVGGRWLGPPPDLPRLYPSVEARVEPEHLATPGPVAGGAAAQRSLTSGEVVSAPAAAGLALFNQGDAKELMELPGLGPVLAGRILELREREGPFEAWDDLTRVRGIGKKLTKRWKESLE